MVTLTSFFIGKQWHPCKNKTGGHRLQWFMPVMPAALKRQETGGLPQVQGQPSSKLVRTHSYILSQVNKKWGARGSRVVPVPRSSAQQCPELERTWSKLEINWNREAGQARWRACSCKVFLCIPSCIQGASFQTCGCSKYLSIVFTFRSYLKQRKTNSKRRREQFPVLDHLLSIVQLPPSNDARYLSQSWAALVVLPHIR